jgi:predicted enzyme related to lactoylglutathione lyase
VNALATAWQKKGVEIVQRPTQMDFGWTFAAVDPDGHRVRVFAPGA